MKRLLASIAAVLFLAAGAARADEGADVYKSKCASCHGPDGKGSAMGKKMGSPELGASKLDAAGVEKVVAAGQGKMMGFKGKLSPEQIKAVATHVKTLK
jgi:mono/diheme cytochrome c family protein